MSIETIHMMQPGSTLVCFAVKEERECFAANAAAQRARMILTGMGGKNALAAITKAFAQECPRLVISAGFAGGLDPSLKTGEVLFDADAGLPLEQCLLENGAKRGRFHCAERVVIGAGEKRELRQATGADAVEMESEWIRRFCRERGVGSATVRVILDTADEDLPLDFNQLSRPDGRVSPFALALALIKSPGKIGELTRFRHRVVQAGRKLGDLLGSVI